MYSVCANGLFCSGFKRCCESLMVCSCCIFLVFSCLCKAKRNLWRHIKGKVVGSIIVLTNVGL